MISSKYLPTQVNPDYIKELEQIAEQYYELLTILEQQDPELLKMVKLLRIKK